MREVCPRSDISNRRRCRPRPQRDSFAPPTVGAAADEPVRGAPPALMQGVNVSKRLLVIVLVVVGLVLVGVAAGVALRDSGSENESSEAIAADGGSADADTDAGQGDADREDGEEGEEDELFEDPGSYWLAQREASGMALTTAMFRRAREQVAAMTASEGTWKDLGPTNIGGRITDLVVDPSSPTTIYVAAAGGGIWKSTDEGMTF